MPYREKRILSGRYLEVDLYPVTLIDIKKSRKEKCKLSKPKQQNLNEKNAKKHLIRLMNANFTEKDLAVHPTYDPEHVPKDEAQARKDIANYIRRLKAYRTRKGLPELKYIAVIECRDPAEGRPSIRIHHHIIMSGDMDRDDIEQIWGRGRCNADRLQPDEQGFAALAYYITKDPKGSKRWCQSKGLKQPEVAVNDHKWSRRKIEQLSQIPEDREHFERLYPGYTFTRCQVSANGITGGLYVRIQMRKEVPRCRGRSTG